MNNANRVWQVINPATLERLASVEETPIQDIPEIVAQARAAQKKWIALAHSERERIITRLRDVIISSQDRIADALSSNTGKPLVEAYTSELFPTISLVNYFLERNLLTSQDIPIGFFNFLGRKSSFVMKPLGVIAIISPWNYPFSITVGNTVIALLTGCSVVLKPSEHTLFVTKIIEELFTNASIPQGLIGIIYGDKNQGQALIDSRPDKVVFTGSVGVGKQIMADCAKHLIPVVLELGGKNPAIVLEDAHLENAANGIMWGGFTNSGQACSSASRVYVQHKVFEQFVSILVEKTKKLRQGDPLDADTDVGAMINEAQLGRVDNMVKKAVLDGAKILCGGKRKEKGYYYEPTILVDIFNSMQIMQDEVFGPVIPIMKFDTDNEAIDLANESRFGLTASVWSTDIKRAQRIAASIEAGTVVVNDSSYTYALAETPWGGIKESGIGVTHSIFGMQEFVRPFHVNINYKFRKKSSWWYPYNKDVIEASKDMAEAVSSRNLAAKLKAIGVFKKLWKRM